MLANIFEAPIMLSPQNRVVPALAERWEISEDGRTFTFHLRSNARFHKPFSRPVTASDIKYSLERALWPATKSPTAAGFFEDIDGAADVIRGSRRDLRGVSVVDDKTVTISLKQRRGFFLTNMLSASVVCREAVEKNGGRIDQNLAIGTGPFTLASYRSGYGLVLEANAEYYRGKPKLARIERRFVVDPATSRVKYDTGEADICAPSIPDLARDLKNPAYAGQVNIEPMAMTVFVGMNENLVPPFADRRVRRAITMAIDKDAIERVACASICKRCDTIFPTVIPAYNPVAKTLRFDPHQASALLAAAGFPEGKGFPTLTLGIVQKVPEWEATATIIRDDLKRNLGIQVNIQEREEGTFFSEMSDGKVPFYMVGFGGSAEPHDFLISYRTRHKFNQSGYSSGDFDRLIDAADLEVDDAKRIPMYRDAEQVLLNDAAVIPLFCKPQQLLIKPYVRDYQINGGGMMPHFTTRIARQP